MTTFGSVTFQVGLTDGAYPEPEPVGGAVQRETVWDPVAGSFAELVQQRPGGALALECEVDLAYSDAATLEGYLNDGVERDITGYVTANGSVTFEDALLVSLGRPMSYVDAATAAARKVYSARFEWSR